jgi:hypothetical protein
MCGTRSHLWHTSCERRGMTIDKIVVLANRCVELQLRVFFRSLRKVGCDLPIAIIPCGATDFEPPEGCTWVKDSELLSFLRQRGAHPLYCKYASLLQHKCAYFDTDIVVLRNPQEWLEEAPSDAFAVADTEWSKNKWTFTPESRRFLATLSSRWPLFTFNSGFFAFEEPLYEEKELISVIQSPETRGTCLERKASPVDQPGINWLVLRKQRNIFNFNLPPQSMESTMVVDYDKQGAVDRAISGPSAPAFLHYAGPVFEQGHFLTELFTSHLTAAERPEWEANIKRKREALRWLENWPMQIRVLNRLVRFVDPRFYVQPKL